MADADLDALAAALGELRAADWSAPEDPDSDEDTDLDGRDHLADRLSDEVDWLRQCAGWLRQLDGGGYPPTVNLRPSADWPDRAVVAVDLARVRAVIDRIAADIDELAPARRVQDLTTAAVLPDPRAEPTAGRAGPGVPGLLRPQGIARLINPATGAGLGCLAGRAIPARRDRPAAGLHRQPVPATLTTRPRARVQETGRRSGAHGSIITGTPERGWQAERVTISERIGAARRERRVLARVSRAAWRLEQAERERRVASYGGPCLPWHTRALTGRTLSLPTLGVEVIARLSSSRAESRRCRSPGQPRCPGRRRGLRADSAELSGPPSAWGLRRGAGCWPGRAQALVGRL